MTEQPPRLDPRAARERRRARPIPRRDPRAEREARRAGLAPSRAVAPARPAPPAPEILRLADETPAWCLVLPDAWAGALSSHDRDAIAAARCLADAAGAGLIAFAPAGAADYGALGIDRLIPSAGFETAEARAEAAAALIARHAPRHVVLPETVIGGGHLGRLLAARLGLPLAAGVTRLLPGGEVLRPADGGRLEQRLAAPPLVLVAPEAAIPPPGPPFGSAREARPWPAPPPAAAGLVRAAPPLPLEPESVPLEDAAFILGGGLGVTDWAGFAALARRLEAACGGTRAACDAGHLPRGRQIGASGRLVDPRCYLALGISGAAQHLQGIARCERVIAVNTDLHAAMIARAQLAVIADAQAVIAELLAMLEARA